MRSDTDRTARADIRDAALRLFAQRGPEATSLRAIAAEAEVSAALIVHHFGGKQGLREAVDAHVDAAFEHFFDLEHPEDVAAMMNDQSGVSMVEAFRAAFPDDSPLPAYLRRLLLTEDPAAVRIFSGWHRSIVVLLTTLEGMGVVRPSADPPTRAAFALIADLAVILLRGPLSVALGYDPLSAGGMPRFAAEVESIYRLGMLTGDQIADGKEHGDE